MNGLSRVNPFAERLEQLILTRLIYKHVNLFTTHLIKVSSRVMLKLTGLDSNNPIKERGEKVNPIKNKYFTRVDLLTKNWR